SASAASLSVVSPVFIPAPPSEDEPDDDEETDGDGDDDEDGPPPYDGPREWTEECVDLAQSVCDVACSSNDEDATAAVCVPWYPGETEASCAGIDLAVGVPCEQSIPVCNHGNTEAPAGIRLVHFPANSQQYPSCEPNLNHPNMAECFTQEPIAPGKCINVTGCPSLTGNREIMVNP